MATLTLRLVASALLVLSVSAVLPVIPFLKPLSNSDASTIGDKGKVTLSGRARANNTIVFGSEVLWQQTLVRTAKVMTDMAKGKLSLPEPYAKDTPRKEVQSRESSQHTSATDAACF
jgi:hypothetical protein